MSLFTKFKQSLQSWRRRRATDATRKRATVGLEQLDHRQLMAVNFTGNVALDFPATQTPGVVVLADNGTIQHPVIPPILQPYVAVSGFDINALRISYTSTDDTLNIGIQQPINPAPFNGVTYPVIAGDADGNGDNSTVNPAISNNRNDGGPGVLPSFLDFPNISGTESMYTFLDLSGTGDPSKYIVAGFSQNQGYRVSLGVPGPSNAAINPDFGVQLPNNEGNVYLVNDPRHGGLEYQITGFSNVYRDVTGKTLTPQSVIQIGAFAGSLDDAIGETYVPQRPFSIGDATPPVIVPPVIVPCPLPSPPILINPGTDRHVNISHNSNVSVTVISSSGFDARQIVASTVRLGGATPTNITFRDVNRDALPDAILTFKGIDINLPPGIQLATLTGQTSNGTGFSSSQLIFVRDDSFYSAGEVTARNTRLGIDRALPTTRNVLNRALLQSTLAMAAEQAAAAQQASFDAVAAAAAGTSTGTATATSMTASMAAPVASNAATAALLLADPSAQTVTPSVVRITPRQAAAAARSSARTASVPTMTAARSFRNAGHLRAGAGSRVTAASAAQAMAVQDAAIASMASGTDSMPQTAA